MTTEEKTKAIIEAIANKRVTGIKLDVSGRGKAVTRIKQGKASKEVVDKIYANLVEILGIPESLEAEPSKEESKEVQEQVAEPQPEKEAVKMEIINKIAERFEAIEQENKELKETIAGLQKEIETLKQGTSKHSSWFGRESITKDNQASITNNMPGSVEYNQNIIPKDNQASGLLRDYERLVVDGLDFVIRLEKQVSNITLASGESKKIEYPRYYAKKKIAGKLHRVYLGDMAERSQAQDKIKAYCNKHQITINEGIEK